MTTAASRTLGCRALVAASCALAIASCGSSGPTPTGFGTTATGDASPFALSHCMRSHGVSNFPDPTAGPGGEGFNGVVSSPGSATLTVDSITFSGPVFQSAQKACRKLLPGGAGPRPPISAAQRKAAIANARCMRTHGVPNFPDPTFPAGGGIAIHGGPGFNPQSPAFTQAAAACGGRFGGRLQQGG
jgi:hypothetical protein